VIRQAGVLVLLAAGGFPALFASATAQSAPAVRIAARIVSAREAEVTARYRLMNSGDGASKVSLLAMRIPGQSVEILDATARGRPLPVLSTLQPGAVHCTLELPDAEVNEYEIRYRLRSDHNARLPLLVPMAEGEHSETLASCEIEVLLPDDWVSVGHEFPWFEHSNGMLRAVLPNLPALIVIQGKRQGDVGLLDRWLTLDHLTNAALFLMLIAASAYRFQLARRGGGRAGAS
jgi:hypothetical protein